MLKMIGVSFTLALQNIRDNFLHTVLSVLGIIIGVAALVGILSFIDGIEKFAREQISSTTSLQSIMIRTNTGRTVDGVHMEKEDWGYFTFEALREMESELSQPASTYLLIDQPQVIQAEGQDSTMGIMLTGAVGSLAPKAELQAGKFFTEEDLMQKRAAVILNSLLAKKLTGAELPEEALGRSVFLKGKEMQVIGVLKAAGEERAQAFIPITHFSAEELKKGSGIAIVDVENVNYVNQLKGEIEAWLGKNLARQKDDFTVITNEFRLKQFSRSFIMFKIVMGLITGLAVLVGGIGIMNVLLISVTERTVEIGVRKAMGAKKRDIVLQFLSESITVSSFGSLMGLLLGMLGTMAAVPLIKHYADAPFEAAFTLSTMLLVGIIAILLGVVFGTYPALRAARLDPVEAIRRE